MKVLLLEDIQGTGWLGDVVDVADGYARNYLLPQQLAQVPNEGNIRAIAEEKAKRAEQRLKERKRMQLAIEKVVGAKVVIVAKANEQGHLFGSVGEKEIGESLRNQGMEVADGNVKMPMHIKEEGIYDDVRIRYASDISTKIEVVVLAMQEGQTEEEVIEAAEKAAEMAAKNAAKEAAEMAENAEAETEPQPEDADKADAKDESAKEDDN